MAPVRAGTAAGIRRLALLLAPLFALLFLTGTAASAHRDVRTVVHHDGLGSVWVDVTWSDGHPVSTPVLATMSARTADGAQIGPVPLRGADPRNPSSIRYEGSLSEGEWTATIDVAAPGVGYCQTRLTVPPATAVQPGEPRSVTCGGTPTVGEPRAATEPRAAGDRSAGTSRWGALGAVAGAALLVACLGYRRWPARAGSRRASR